MYKERQRTRKKTSLHLSSVAKSVQSLPTRTTVMQVAKEKTWSNSNQKTQQHHHKKETYLTEEKTEKSVSSSIVYSTKQSSHSSEKVTPSILWTLCPGYLMIHTCLLPTHFRIHYHCVIINSIQHKTIISVIWESNVLVIWWSIPAYFSHTSEYSTISTFSKDWSELYPSQITLD